jgi:hypothetical protein
MKETLEKHSTRFKISETSRRFEARVRLLEGSGLLLDMRNCFASHVKRDNPNIFFKYCTKKAPFIDAKLMLY